MALTIRFYDCAKLGFLILSSSFHEPQIFDVRYFSGVIHKRFHKDQ